MHNYIILAIGWLVGQFGYATASAYIIQKDIAGIEWKQAFKIYLQKETGSFAMSFALLLIVLFIFPDFFDPTVTRADLKSKATLTYIERMLLYLRLSAVVVGAFSQHLLYVFFKKGKKGIHDLAAANKLSDKTIEDLV